MKKGFIKTISFITVLMIMLSLYASAVFAEPALAEPEEELWCSKEECILKNGDQDIFGYLYLPLEEKEKYPVVIISHGFAGTADAGDSLAQTLAENGFAAYAFDFIGGSVKSRSGAADGDMSHMSVLTEAADLSAVMDGLLEMPFIDAEKLFLLGQSQGGYVSAYVAAQRPEDIRALILQFPAFALQDDCWERHGAIENVPEAEHFMGQELGGIYSLDAMSMDIYDVIGAYKGDVLIVHGDSDKLVDLSYSEKAEQVYESAELIVYEGAGHGFFGDSAEQFAQDVLAFLEEHVEN